MNTYLIFAVFLYLYKHKKTTAAQIANNLNTSSRNVYRIINSLSLCGIPVLTRQGRGGGIELDTNFVLERMLLSRQEQEIVKECINSVKDTKIKNILLKLI